ncbi:cupin domain-containing protein [Congregibacter sp.]|uniref:cupin domain-containing protein n=1 Tax=Congregibacter sp. TaxID=2744308 RepID=UPI003858963C
MLRAMFINGVFISAAIASGTAAAHDPVTWNETVYEVLLDGETTSGQISIFYSETEKPSGPPLHIHDDATETFYVLKGKTKFVVEGKDVIVEEGGVAFVPKGAAHTYRVLDPNGGQQLTILAPAGFEHFFARMAEEGLKIPQDMERINEVAKEFKIRFVGPPLPADE